MLISLALAGCGGAQLAYRNQDHMGPGLSFGGKQSAAGRPAAPGSGSPSSASPAASASAAEAAALPDPKATRGRQFWRYTMAYERGQVRVARVRAVAFGRDAVTPRYLGRFAIELWIGDELLERVRFDFPLLPADPMDEPPGAEARRRVQPERPPRFAPGLTATRQVLVPNLPRATRAVLVDRARGLRRALPWPPDDPLPPLQLTPPRAEPVDSAPVDSAPVGSAPVGSAPVGSGARASGSRRAPLRPPTAPP